MRFGYRANPLRDFSRRPCGTLSATAFCGHPRNALQVPYSHICLSRHGTQSSVFHGPMPPRLSFCPCVLPVSYNAVKGTCFWYG